MLDDRPSNSSPRRRPHDRRSQGAARVRGRAMWSPPVPGATREPVSENDRMHTLSELVAHEQDAIITQWLEQARLAASARGLDQPALTNIMPRYLASLGAGEDGSQHVERHFATRLRQGFQLAEIIDEFTLLGHCIAERSFTGP